ncbi:uncharacterized protein BBA_04551 [Beauveria bassiana ARSEF 2860]|uniref:Uncharacterized protein n=1 Tax=Beauveria bassiana (strain ARSEF 2860) TaxID=655819 RepID=J5JW50_BEAB2|nr:uncharacterized protein BBA_04551 [Beauveria bassiana ARSEF 2860]EJP66611.1 hypothetical protein BBA_04551 [Beauveria bassiana ARSEF 2860]
MSGVAARFPLRHQSFIGVERKNPIHAWPNAWEPYLTEVYLLAQSCNLTFDAPTAPSPEDGDENQHLLTQSNTAPSPEDGDENQHLLTQSNTAPCDYVDDASGATPPATLPPTEPLQTFRIIVALITVTGGYCRKQDEKSQPRKNTIVAGGPTKTDRVPRGAGANVAAKEAQGRYFCCIVAVRLKKLSDDELLGGVREEIPWLLLDQVLDALRDEETRGVLEEAFDDCTVLTIAHREETIRRVDFTVALDDGEMATIVAAR